ncbi:hypothetical protein GGR57DRAFT_351303 [Xylariaceae sp. FL1272]|nr:hypothetical protein GGR57DRAFT_351303 [Xylariaceae sp. FL1272]
MKFAMWTGVAFIGLIASSRAQEMPKCAADCLKTCIAQSQCSIDDFDCICADTNLLDIVGTCSLKTCTIVEGLAAKNATNTLCGIPARDNSLTAPIATAVTGGLAFLAVLLRCCNSFLAKEFNWADTCAVLAMLSSIPMDVYEFFMRRDGMGKDIWTLTPDQITSVLKSTWVVQVSYIPAIILTKICIICFYLRIFAAVEKFMIICYITIAYCVCFLIATFLAQIFGCSPISQAWTGWSGQTQGTCFDTNAFWWAHSALNIATDLWIMAIPISQIRKLQMSLKRKVYLSLMFSVGIIITIISIIRFSGLITYSTTSNPTYNNVAVTTFSVIECNLSIVCCCMPTLLALSRRLFSTRITTTDHSDSSGGSSNATSRPQRGIQKSVETTISSTPKTKDFEYIMLVESRGPPTKHKW